MQHNILTPIRTTKITDGCKSTHFYAHNSSAVVDSPNTTGGGEAFGDKKLFHHLLDRSKHSGRFKPVGPKTVTRDVILEGLLPCGLPSFEIVEPSIESCLKPVDLVETLAGVYRRIEDYVEGEKSEAFLEQCEVFKGLPDVKLFWWCLRLARKHAVDVHMKVMLASWLRYERREDEKNKSSCTFLNHQPINNALPSTRYGRNI